jgi:ATP-dependent Clp protease protease subunit
MGAVLMTAGEKGKRTALPHSRIMIHQPLGGAQGQASDIEITYKEISKLKKELYDILAHHSGQPYETIEKDGDRDFWMTAQEAKEYGMIDEVLKIRDKK